MPSLVKHNVAYIHTADEVYTGTYRERIYLRWPSRYVIPTRFCQYVTDKYLQADVKIIDTSLAQQVRGSHSMLPTSANKHLKQI
jgi:hypothetical protein